MSFGFIRKIFHRQPIVPTSSPDASDSQLTYDAVYHVTSGHTDEFELRCVSCGNEVKLSTARFCLARRSRFSGRIYCNECMKSGHTLSN